MLLTTIHMLEAVPLDIAFGPVIHSGEMESELRHKRRDRVASTPPAPNDAGLPPQKRSKKPAYYDSECTRPIPTTTPTTCPHCMHVLEMRTGVDPDQSASANLPYGTPENTPLRPLVREHMHDGPTAAPPQSSMMQTQSYQQPQISIEPVVRAIRSLSPEIVYALALLLIVLLVAWLDSRSSTSAAMPMHRRF